MIPWDSRIISCPAEGITMLRKLQFSPGNKSLGISETYA